MASFIREIFEISFAFILTDIPAKGSICIFSNEAILIKLPMTDGSLLKDIDIAQQVLTY